MGFATAIPINAVADSSDPFCPSGHRESFRKGWGSRVRQKVNISEETTSRVAREKLGRAIERKLAYNRFGRMASLAEPGSVFSRKA